MVILKIEYLILDILYLYLDIFAGIIVSRGPDDYLLAIVAEDGVGAWEATLLTHC